MKTHELKIWPQYFDAVRSGLKTFEIRRDDRNFAVGDRLVLEEWDPETEQYTGRALMTIITYKLPGAVLRAGFCALSIVMLGVIR